MGIVTKKPILNEDISALYTSSLESLKLFIGLGNPGDKYAANRHNAGFMCLNRLADLSDIAWQNKPDFKSQFAQTDIGGARIMLIKPQTYVNLSGEALAAVADFYKLAPGDIYVIHDEIRHPFGTIEVCRRHEHFGHNGLKSIKNFLKGELQLIRVGIGPKRPEQISLSDFVLADFTANELEKLPSVTKEVCSLIGEAGAGPLKAGKRSILP